MKNERQRREKQRNEKETEAMQKSFREERMSVDKEKAPDGVSGAL